MNSVYTRDVRPPRHFRESALTKTICSTLPLLCRALPKRPNESDTQPQPWPQQRQRVGEEVRSPTKRPSSHSCSMSQVSVTPWGISDPAPTESRCLKVPKDRGDCKPPLQFAIKSPRNPIHPHCTPRSARPQKHRPLLTSVAGAQTATVVIVLHFYRPMAKLYATPILCSHAPSRLSSVVSASKVQIPGLSEIVPTFDNRDLAVTLKHLAEPPPLHQEVDPSTVPMW